MPAPPTLADCSLVVDTLAAPGDIWCAFEHQAALEAGQPPVVILVSACKLVDVYRLTEGKTNSDWHAIFAHGGSVLVRIIATGDKMAVFRFAQRHAQSFNPLPRCNLRGFNVRGSRRAVRCSNGHTYPTQRAAAEALGISQSAISQHLDGKLRAVQGLTFDYAAPEQVTIG